MNVQQLIDILSELDPEARVFVAVQPQWPFEHGLQGVAVRSDFATCDPEEELPEETDRWSAPETSLPGSDVLLVTGEQVRYGNAGAWDAVRRP